MKITATITCAILTAALWGCSGMRSTTAPTVKLPPPPDVDTSSLSGQPKQLLDDALIHLRQNPNDGGLNGHVGMLLHAFKRYEDAAKFYARTRKIAPRSGRWSYYHGVALAETKDIAAAAEAFNNNLEVWDDHGPTRLRLALVYFEAAALTKSEALAAKGRETLDALVSELPDYLPGSIEKARRLAAAADDSAAIALLEKVIEQGYGGNEAHLELAKLYERNGNRSEAERYEVLGANRPPVGLDDQRWTGRILELASANLGYSDRAEALVQARMLGPAANEWERAVEAGEKKLEARVNLVAIYGMQDQIPKAEQHYSAALREGLENGKLHLNMATIRLAQGRQKDAREAYLRAIAIDPFLVKAYQGLSRSHLLEGNFSEAVRWARQATQREPTNFQALAELARALAQAGQHAESIEQYKKAARFSEGANQIHVLRILAETQAKAHDLGGAATTLREAREVADKAGNNVQALLIDSQIEELAGSAQSATP